MTKTQSPTEISISICEAALERYSALDDSLAELIRQASIEVRDFMLLSFVCDQGSMSVEQINRALGISPESTRHCVDRLIQAQLVYYNNVEGELDGDRFVSPTATGKQVTRGIHGHPG